MEHFQKIIILSIWFWNDSGGIQTTQKNHHSYQRLPGTNVYHRRKVMVKSRKPTIIYFCQGTHHGIVCKNILLGLHFRRTVRKIQGGDRWSGKTFEPNRPTCLATDWSKSGIGFNLIQKHCRCSDTANPSCGEGHWKLVLAGFCFTTDTESRYAPIEGEALPVAYGLQRCRMFIMGSPDLILAVNHKLLIKIFNDRELISITNPRILQLKEKTLLYHYKIIHAAGKSLQLPGKASNTRHHRTKNALPYCKLLRMVSPRQNQNYSGVTEGVHWVQSHSPREKTLQEHKKENILFVLPDLSFYPTIEKWNYLPILWKLYIGAAKILKRDNHSNIAIAQSWFKLR